VFERQVPVRWRDTDALGHVNHAVFLTYLEEGRDAFYAQVLDGNLDYVVVRIELDLRAEVRHRDRYVTVQIQAERLGTTSLTTRETILASNPAPSPASSPAPPSSGEVVAEARVVTVRWNPSQRKPVPFSEAERARLTASIP
jgi:acyl-CoA thioester hydrolase